MALVTLDDLRLALKNRLCIEGMPETDTEQLAEYLMSFFGFSDQATTNALLLKIEMSSICWKRKAS